MEITVSRVNGKLRIRVQIGELSVTVEIPLWRELQIATATIRAFMARS